jgi:hypothetical protein
MKPVDVPIEDYTFGDGSMNARQYHAWLWAQVPKDVSEAKLQQMSRVIDALTIQFMADSFNDPQPEQKGGLAELLK